VFLRCRVRNFRVKARRIRLDDRSAKKRRPATCEALRWDEMALRRTCAPDADNVDPDRSPEHEAIRIPMSQISTDGHLKRELIAIVTPLAMRLIDRYADRAEEVAIRRLAKCSDDNAGEITWQLVLLAIWELQPRER
jgi:hypothetical protein